jgi:hypothetical protein
MRRPQGRRGDLGHGYGYRLGLGLGAGAGRTDGCVVLEFIGSGKWATEGRPADSRLRRRRGTQEGGEGCVLPGSQN